MNALIVKNVDIYNLGHPQQFVELKPIRTRDDEKHENNLQFRPDAASWSRAEGDTYNLSLLFNNNHTCLT